MFGVMDLVGCVSLFMFSGTLNIAGTPAVIGVAVASYILLCIARSVI